MGVRAGGLFGVYKLWYLRLFNTYTFISIFLWNNYVYNYSFALKLPWR